MGVYIKDMTLDEFSEYGDYCQTLIGTGQAEEVPPHGRLGDLDELDKKHEKLSRDFCHGYLKSSWDFVCAARKLFEDAPTIVPAEEGET